MTQEQLNEELLTAITYCDIEECKLLLEKGADVNFQDRNGITPIHVAKRDLYEAKIRLEGFVELIDLLKQHGGVA